MHDVHCHPTPLADFALVVKSHILACPEPLGHLNLGRIQHFGQDGLAYRYGRDVVEGIDVMMESRSLCQSLEKSRKGPDN